MPEIKVKHVVSSSSEDPNHKAENLVKPGTYRKWRCEKPGVQNAIVIFQLEKETQICMVDIGNNGSAFVEVLVGNSSDPPEKPYEVLLMSSSFMSPVESRNGEQMNRVRMFTADKLCADAAKKKWDRVKVVCTQPYGPHLQYGLTFINLHSPEDEENSLESSVVSPESRNSPPPVKLGRFTLKPEEDDDILPGSVFARRKFMDKEENSENSPRKPKTVAATIAAASSPASLAAMEAAIQRKTAQVTAKIPKKRPPPENSSMSSSPKIKRRNGLEESDENRPKDNRKTLESDSPSPPPQPEKNKNPKENRKPSKRVATPPHSPSPPECRPFNQLLAGVTFVLSGFQNPLRSNLRDLALSMGAKYQGDWGRGCTHLICAFVNTPKANQVRGKGKIVRKEWLEHCHRERKRFPWRRYALDRKDQDGDESEEEIWESPDATPGPSSSNARDGGQDESSKPSTSGRMTGSQEAAGNGKSEPDCYDVDTDVDDDVDTTETSTPAPFSGLKFALHEDLPQAEKDLLRKTITNLEGTVLDDLEEDLNYLVSTTSDGLNELSAFYPEVRAVQPGWIEKCSETGTLCSVTEHLIHPVDSD